MYDTNSTLFRMLMRPQQKGSIQQVRFAFQSYLDAKNLHPVNKLNCQRGLEILLENVELESQKLELKEAVRNGDL